jgi:hypothetical protein
VAEERQQQLEVALTENHVALQQRNAELAMVKKVCVGVSKVGSVCWRSGLLACLLTSKSGPTAGAASSLASCVACR